MKRILTVICFSVAAYVLTGCTPSGTPASNAGNTATANTANSNAAAKPAAAAPTKEALMTMEKAGWEAWKNRDAKWMVENASDKYVGFGPTGRMDKASSVKTYTDQKCEIKSYSLSDDQMTMLGADVAVLTFKGTQDYTCDGKKGPGEVWSGSVYVREGDKWKAVYYAETPVVDPKAPPAKAAPAADKKPADTAKADALTEAIMAVETKAWEAWKARDAKAFEPLATKDFMSFSGMGRRDRAASFKAWFESKCEGNGFSLAEPMAVELSKDVALVTYKASVQGKCDGQANTPSLWVASFNLKEGNEWKNAFYMDLPR